MMVMMTLDSLMPAFPCDLRQELCCFRVAVKHLFEYLALAKIPTHQDYKHGEKYLLQRAFGSVSGPEQDIGFDRSSRMASIIRYPILLLST